MPDLIDQLGAYKGSVESAITEAEATRSGAVPDRVTEDRVATELMVWDFEQPEPNGRPSEPRRRIGLLAAVAAATLIVVGMVVIADRYREAPVTAPISADALSYQWSRVAHDEAAFGGERSQVMTSVVAGGPGLVAVGHDGLWDESTRDWYPDPSAAVWTSEDGIVWSRVPHDEEIFGGAAMSDVTLGGPGLVAVGWSPSGDTAVWDGASDAAVWTSVDGLTWSRVHDDSFSASSFTDPVRAYNAMNSVVVGGPGLVAVGKEGGAAAAVWTSVDGLTWTRVPHDREIFGSPTALGFGMNSVTAGGPGLVAVGAWAEEPVNPAKVWTSVDGLTWTRVPDDEAGFDGGAPWSVTAGGPGLVAVGEDGTAAAVWTSVDGFEWVQVPDDEAIFSATYGSASAPDSGVYQSPPAGAGLAMSEVIAVGHGLVAVGGPTYNYRGPSDGDLGAAVWTSPDGITWSRVSHDTAVFGGTGENGISSVTTAGSNLVAVGSHQSSIDANAAVWVAAGTR
jgi:hypothetical protein